MNQSQELSASRHITSAELSALHVLLSSSGQAALANTRRQFLTFHASTGASEPVEWGDAGPAFHWPSIASPRMASVVPGMVPAEGEAVPGDMVGGTAATGTAFVTIERAMLRQLLASLNDLDLRADRAERGTLRTIRMAMEARLTTLPHTAAEIRTLVAAVAQDIAHASDVVQDEARELDRIGFAFIMALQALHDVECAA